MTALRRWPWGVDGAGARAKRVGGVVRVDEQPRRGCGHPCVEPAPALGDPYVGPTATGSLLEELGAELAVVIVDAFDHVACLGPAFVQGGLNGQARLVFQALTPIGPIQ